MRELKDAFLGSLFATPILEHMWSDAADLNPQLRDSILDHARRHSGTEQSNVGGWHSPSGTLDFCGAAGVRLLRHMGAMTEEATRRLYEQFGRRPEPASWVLSAWANVAWRGDFNRMHTHPGATWSGVYYVDGGNADAETEETAIYLADPNAARANLFFPELSCQPMSFRPQSGLMILFPSYVPHHVPPHRGERPRISIAFNVRKDPFP